MCAGARVSSPAVVWGCGVAVARLTRRRWCLTALVTACLLLPASSALAAPLAGTISTVAGDPAASGPATTLAQHPGAVVASPGGSLYMVDSFASSVREVNAAGQETTVAGNGHRGFSGDGGLATEAELYDPTGLVVDSGGDLLIIEYDAAVIGEAGRVRLVAATNCTSDCPYGLPATTKGDIYTVAGGGTAGYCLNYISADGEPATAAELYRPEGLAVDGAGDLLISDTGCNRVLLVAAANCTSDCPYGLASTTKGDIYTVAGTGTEGFSGDGGPATKAELFGPGAVAVDNTGDLLISDAVNDAGDSQVQLVAAQSCTSDCPYGLTTTIKGDIYTIVGTEKGSSGDGGPATDAELFDSTGLAVDSAGDLLITDHGSRVRLVAATGCTSDCPYGLAATTKGDIYTVAGSGTGGFSGDGGPATNAELYLDSTPSDVAVDSAGDLVISDTGNNRVRLVAATNCSSDCPYGLAAAAEGYIYTIAGNGNIAFSGDAGPAINAQLDLDLGLYNGVFYDGAEPSGLVVDSAGDLLISDTGNDRVRLVAATNCSSNCPYGLAATTKGDIYTVAGGGMGLDRLGSATEVELSNPSGLAVDSAGDLLISDTGADVVLLVAATNCTRHCPYGLAATTKGDIYTVAGDYDGGLPSNGARATETSLGDPTGLAVDSAGDLLISDGGSVVLVAAADCASNCPYGLAATTKDDIYAVAGDGNFGFSGDGGPATNAEIAYSGGVAVDSAGDLLIGDTGNDRVRLVAAESCASNCPYGLAATTKGDIYTVAGNGSDGLSGDGGPASKAKLYAPSGVAVDSAGDLLISDTGNDRVQLVAAESCASNCPYGLAATTKGDIYTIAGNDNQGFSGDGGPASDAELFGPDGLAVDGGDLLISDTGNNRVRLVTGDTPPFFTAASPPETLLAGSSFEYTFSAAGYPPPTYTLSPGAPSWLTIDPSTGRLTGAVPAGIVNFSYSVTATNSFGSRTAGPFFTAAATPVSVTGTVRYSNGEPVAYGVVDACLASGGLCYSTVTNVSGAFSVGAIPGTTIVLSVYPPQGKAEDYAPSESRSMLVPADGLQGEAVTLDAIAMLGNVSLGGAGGPGLKMRYEAVLYWAWAERVSVEGCPHGLATIEVTARNEFTKAFESNVEALEENPNEAGKYSGILAPQEPLHGPAQILSSVSCPPQSALVPNSGPSSGGNNVVVTGSGFTGATAVDFGDVPATRYTVLSDEAIEAVAPPGTGTVPVTVFGSGVPGGSVVVDQYTYVAVQSISPSSGPPNSRTGVIIKGTGLGSARAVRFGQTGAEFTQVSSTELQAVSPRSGEGTQDITVETAYGGTTPITPADQFTYTAGLSKTARSSRRDRPRPSVSPVKVSRATAMGAPPAATSGLPGAPALSSASPTAFPDDAPAGVPVVTAPPRGAAAPALSPAGISLVNSVLNYVYTQGPELLEQYKGIKAAIRTLLADAGCESERQALRTPLILPSLQPSLHSPMRLSRRSRRPRSRR